METKEIEEGARYQTCKTRGCGLPASKMVIDSTGEIYFCDMHAKKESETLEKNWLSAV